MIFVKSPISSPSDVKVVDVSLRIVSYSLQLSIRLSGSPSLSNSPRKIFLYYYPGQKKKPCVWCTKSESCDNEESRCLQLIQLSAEASTRVNATCTDESRCITTIPLRSLRYHMMNYHDGFSFVHGSTWSDQSLLIFSTFYFSFVFLCIIILSCSWLLP